MGAEVKQITDQLEFVDFDWGCKICVRANRAAEKYPLFD